MAEIDFCGFRMVKDSKTGAWTLPDTLQNPPSLFLSEDFKSYAARMRLISFPFEWAEKTLRNLTNRQQRS